MHSSGHASLALLAFALASAAVAADAAEAQHRLPVSEFGSQIEMLDEYVLRTLRSSGREAEFADMIATWRKQMEAGLISREQFDEAVDAVGGGAGTIEHRGRPFTGSIVAPATRRNAPYDEVTAEFEDGILRHVAYQTEDGRTVREIEMDGGSIVETRFWSTYPGAPRDEVVYTDEYMGDSVTRTYSPNGELIREGGPGGTRYGSGWTGGLNMWDENNALYSAIETCTATKYYLDGSYLRVVGPRAGGCAVEYGFWSQPHPTLPGWAGERMTCVYRPALGSGYRFVDVLTDLELPSEECDGGLAERIRAAP